MERTISVWSDWNIQDWSALKVVHFDWSGHFGRSDWNVPLHLTKLLSPVLLYCNLHTRTITRCGLDWVCAAGMYRSNSQNFKLEFLLNVWFQKISIPPPRKIIGNSEGEGGFKGSNFWGVMELSTPGLPFPTLNIDIHPGIINTTCNETMVNKKNISIGMLHLLK